MKLCAPKYYKKFKCVADRCAHSCCIGWEIDIDAETYSKYEIMKDGYGREIQRSISLDGSPHFKLCAHDRCPHLDERGLCKIILNLGEDWLCGICREHPRFYNYTGVAEVGVGMSCREAAKLILSSDDYDLFEEIGEVDAIEEAVFIDARKERENVYKLLRGETADYKTRLNAIYDKYRITAGDDRRWLEIINSLEYLDPSHKSLFVTYSSQNRPQGKDEYLERALAYFIFRHCTEAYDTEDFALRLSFCLFCERLLASLVNVQKAETLEEIALLSSIVSEEIEYSENNTEALTC